MSEVPILKETSRTTGREALRNNITAAMALAGAVRTTLGPLGQDKLLIDDEGRTMVTNDGVTVLESAKVEHPVAKMLINASTTQDRIARDGTTSAVLLSAELLQNAWELVLQGVHPSAIARGYRHAEEACRQHFETLVIEATEEHMMAAATTSLSGKIHRAMQDHLAALAIQAAKATATADSRLNHVLKNKIIVIDNRLEQACEYNTTGQQVDPPLARFADGTLRPEPDACYRSATVGFRACAAVTSRDGLADVVTS